MRFEASIGLSVATALFLSACGTRVELAEALPDAGASLAKAAADGAVVDPPTPPGWRSEAIGALGLVSLGFLADDEPFVLGWRLPYHYGAWNFGIDAAVRRNGQWTVEPTDVLFGGPATPNAVSHQALPTGLPFYEGTLYLLERWQPSWDAYDLGAYPRCDTVVGALAADGKGVEIVASCNGVLRHSSWDGDRVAKIALSWKDVGSDEARQMHDPGTQLQLLVGSRGDLHAVFENPSTKELRYWHRDSWGWSAETLRSDFDGTAAFAVLDLQGRMAFCWEDSAAAVSSVTAMCERRVGTQWAEKTIVLNHKGPSFRLIGTLMDASGRFNLLTTEETQANLATARTVTYWVEERGGWRKTDLVTSSGEVFASFASDSKGAVHIVVSTGAEARLLSPLP